MSEILKRLKQAEEARARVLAERKRLEAEAEVETDEALAAQPAAAPAAEPPAPPAAETPQQRSRFAAALAIGVAMAIVFWVGTLVPQKPVQVVQGPASAPPAPVAKSPPQLFRMDGDLDAFAARVRKDKP